MTSDAIRKKNICVFFRKKHVFLCKKNLASKKNTQKVFFLYSFKRNYKLTVA